MAKITWFQPSEAQIAQAQEIADRLGIEPYWEGNTLCVGYDDPVPEVQVPTVVSPRQIKLALHAQGLLDSIEAFVAQADRSVQINWESAVEWQRDNELLNSMATAFGLDSTQVDQLFILAASL
jgi:hypothetical protein